jgi:hypothetical protein
MVISILFLQLGIELITAERDCTRISVLEMLRRTFRFAMDWRVCVPLARPGPSQILAPLKRALSGIMSIGM